MAAEPKFTAPVSSAAGFDEIYQAAEIQPPAHGYTIMKIADMLHSERIRTLPAEVKKSSVLLALDAAGVKIEEVIEDAVKRDRALDGFERVQQKALNESGKPLKMQENQQIQADMDRLVQEHKARIQGQQRRRWPRKKSASSPGGCKSRKRNKKSPIPYLILWPKTRSRPAAPRLRRRTSPSKPSAPKTSG